MIAKIVILIQSMEQATDLMADTDDVFYFFALLSLIATVEQNIVITIGCVPKLGAISKLGLLAIIGSISASLASFLKVSRRDRSSAASSSQPKIHFTITRVTRTSKCSLASYHPIQPTKSQ